MATLLLRKALLLFTLRAAAIHFTITQVILKKESATVTFARSRLNRCFTAWKWTFDDRFAGIAPVLSFEGFTTFWTLFIRHPLLHSI